MGQFFKFKILSLGRCNEVTATAFAVVLAILLTIALVVAGYYRYLWRSLRTGNTSNEPQMKMADPNSKPNCSTTVTYETIAEDQVYHNADSSSRQSDRDINVQENPAYGKL